MIFTESLTCAKMLTFYTINRYNIFVIHGEIFKIVIIILLNMLFSKTYRWDTYAIQWTFEISIVSKYMSIYKINFHLT